MKLDELNTKLTERRSILSRPIRDELMSYYSYIIDVMLDDISKKYRPRFCFNVSGVGKNNWESLVIDNIPKPLPIKSSNDLEFVVGILLNMFTTDGYTIECLPKFREERGAEIRVSGWSWANIYTQQH
jgi:hypothetical protein